MNTDGIEFRDWLRKYIKSLRKMKKDIAKLGWAVEDLLVEAEEFLAMDDSKPRRNRTSSRASRARTGAARESNARYVQTGVATIVMQRSTDGWMYAHVENIGLPVQLKTSQRLRELVLALCGRVSHVNRPEHGLVPFKTSEEVIDAIKAISGEEISLGNLHNLVQALRDRMSEALVNPDLVETGGGGYRLRLQLDGEIHDQLTN